MLKTEKELLEIANHYKNKKDEHHKKEKKKKVKEFNKTLDNLMKK